CIAISIFVQLAYSLSHLAQHDFVIGAFNLKQKAQPILNRSRKIGQLFTLQIRSFNVKSLPKSLINIINICNQIDKTTELRTEVQPFGSLDQAPQDQFVVRVASLTFYPRLLRI